MLVHCHFSMFISCSLCLPSILHLIFHLYHAMPCLFSMLTIYHACLWSPHHEALSLSWSFVTLIFVVYMCMRPPCCSLFYMLRPLFSSKQSTIVFYSFRTWTLLFVSSHLEHHSMRYFGWKLEKICSHFRVLLHVVRAFFHVAWRSHTCHAAKPSDHARFSLSCSSIPSFVL